MALTPNQAILTVTTKGAEVAKAIVALEALLEAYPDARIITLTHNIDQLAGMFSGKTTLVAVVEYTPSRSDDTAL